MEQVLLKLGQALLNGISVGRVEEDGQEWKEHLRQKSISKLSVVGNRLFHVATEQVH